MICDIRCNLMRFLNKCTINDWLRTVCIACDSEMKFCSATTQNTLKQQRWNTSSQANVNNFWEQLLFISIAANTLNKKRRCARTWYSLCAYGACWKHAVWRSEDVTSHASASGGWWGDTACWNSMLKSVREAKCAEDSGLHWSDLPILTLPDGSYTTNTPAVDKTWFQ